MQETGSFLMLFGGSIMLLRPSRRNSKREDSCPISVGRPMMSELSLRSSVWSEVKEQTQSGTRGSLFLARLRERSAGADICFGFIDDKRLFERSRSRRHGDHSATSGSSLSLLCERLRSSKFGSFNRL